MDAQDSEASVRQDNVKPDLPSMVCGRILTGDPARFRPTAYQGRTIYFCTGFCLDAFLADPDRFYIAHSRRRDR